MRKNNFILFLSIGILFLSCSETQNIDDSINKKTDAIFFSCSDDDTDICLSLENGNLYYISNVDIAGYQFSHNGCVIEAGGGDSDSNGFEVKISDTAVISFSFKLDVIPSGNGNLISLQGNISKSCLSNFVFASKKGKSLSFSWAAKSEI